MAGPMRTTRFNLRSLAVTVVAAVAAVACTPAPATSTTSGQVPEHHRFKLVDAAPRIRYTLSFADDTPDLLRAEVRAAAAAVTAASGITFTEAAPTADLDAAPAVGEIRVRVGMLCGVKNEAGCAVSYAYPGRLASADVSIAPGGLNQPYLRDVVLHEMAHTVGLGHVDPGEYAPQVMGNPTGVVLGEYQSGDLEGLGRVGAIAYEPASETVGAASVPEIVSVESIVVPGA